MNKDEEDRLFKQLIDLSNRLIFLELKEEIEYIKNKIHADLARLHFKSDTVEFIKKDNIHGDICIKSIRLDYIREHYNTLKLSEIIIFPRGSENA